MSRCNAGTFFIKQNIIMNNQEVIIFEINEKRIQKWKKWCNLLKSTYRNEIIKSLEEEGADHEMFISFELNGKTYGIAYLEGNCAPYNKEREVNKIHHSRTTECLRRVSKANILYSIKRP